jgi:hypothetical protein
MIPKMTATMSPPPRTRLTAIDIDRLAAEFLELESKVDELYKLAVTADEPHERMREQLIDLAEEFGSRHNEKSKLLLGSAYEIVATFGTTTCIDAAAVDRFAHQLRLHKQNRVFELIFEQSTRYTLRPNAGHAIRMLPRPLAALYSACHVTIARHPTLAVRRRIVAGE